MQHNYWVEVGWDGGGGDSMSLLLLALVTSFIPSLSCVVRGMDPEVTGDLELKSPRENEEAMTSS